MGSLSSRSGADLLAALLKRPDTLANCKYKTRSQVIVKPGVLRIREPSHFAIRLACRMFIMWQLSLQPA
jgi:hypothetical protein